jgi:hypothetical protein
LAALIADAQRSVDAAPHAPHSFRMVRPTRAGQNSTYARRCYTNARSLPISRDYKKITPLASTGETSFLAANFKSSGGAFFLSPTG